MHADTLKCRKSSPRGEKLQLCQRQTFFQLESKQKVFILIVYSVSNLYQKGSEAAYTNIYNRIIKNNNIITQCIQPLPLGQAQSQIFFPRVSPCVLIVTL